MEVIYSRVSTDKQDADNQVSSLKQSFPNAAIVQEVASGAKHRPELEKLIARLTKGDVLIVAALDRLGRRTSEILLLIEDLELRGITLKSVREGLDYSTICGRLVTQILVSIAEMERRLISERTKAALNAKRAKGIIGGRKPSFPPEKRDAIRAARKSGATLKAIAKQFGLSTSRVFQLTKEIA